MSAARCAPLVSAGALAGFRGAPPPAPNGVPPYISTEQLAELTPWSVQAINTMRKRGIFKVGVHYFQPAGKGGQVIFKWAAVVELIESGALKDTDVVDHAPTVVGLANGKVIDVNEATERANRLLS